MTKEEARALVFTLRSAFPLPAWDRSTIDLYAMKLEAFNSAPAAVKAINNLIETKTWRPSFAEVKEEYLNVARDHRLRESDERGLKLPDLTDKDREENLRRLRELQDNIGREV